MPLPREGPLYSATLVASASLLLPSPELTNLLDMPSNPFATDVAAYLAVLAASAAGQHGHPQLAPRAGEFAQTQDDIGALDNRMRKQE